MPDQTHSGFAGSRARLAGITLAAVAVAAVVAANLTPPGLFFERPRKMVRLAQDALAHNVCSKTGMATYWTFDEPDPRDAIFKFPTPCPGTELVRGKFGKARRFSGDFGTGVLSGYRMEFGRIGCSLAIWLNLDARTPNQEILCTAADGVAGIRLEEGRMTLEWTTTNGIESISYPYSQYGRFAHVAATFDPESEKARLYENGVLMAEGDFRHPATFVFRVLFGHEAPLASYYSLHGIIDDAAVWPRALHPDEIHRLARSGDSLVGTLASGHAKRKLLLVELYAGAMEGIGRLAEAVRVRHLLALCKRMRQGTALPTVSVTIGGGPERALARAHVKSLSTGRRTKSASRPAEAFVRFHGFEGIPPETLPCRLSLHGSEIYYPRSRRPSYVLELPAPDGGDPSFRLLAAPESCGWLYPAIEAMLERNAGLDSPRHEAVRLKINGSDRGIFLCSDYSRLGLVPGKGPSPLAFLGAVQPFVAWEQEAGALSPTCVSSNATSLARGRKAPLAEIERLRKMAATLCDDHRSPLPRRLREKLAGESVGAIDALAFGPSSASDLRLDAFAVLGDNPSPWRVTTDLPFTNAVASLADGMRLTFTSLDPEVIDDSGRLTATLRREDRPRTARVRVEAVDSHGQRATTELRFRVVAADAKIGALSVATRSLPCKTFNADAMLESFRENDGARRLLAAFGEHGAGFSFRGNSSFKGDKKLVKIKTALPHGLFGDSPTRHILAVNATTDPSRTANILAYRLFREAVGTNHPYRALVPEEIFAELFVNGHYCGLFEFSERVDADLLGSDNVVVFRHDTSPHAQRVIAQRRPRPAERSFEGKFAELENLVANPGGGDWPQKVRDAFDTDSLIALQLVFSVLQNYNGWPNDFLFQEILVYDAERDRFFYVPWDFDRSLRIYHGFMETDFGRNLAANDPAFKAERAAVWRRLRKGPFSDAAMLATMDEVADKLRGYVEFDIEKWLSPDAEKFRDDDLAFRKANLCGFAERIDKIIEADE